MSDPQQKICRVLDRVTCPACNQENVAVMPNFKLYGHGRGRDGKCEGAPAEIIFTLLLRYAGLDGRPDNEECRYDSRFDYDAEAAAAGDEEDRRAWLVKRARLAKQVAERLGAIPDLESVIEVLREIDGGGGDPNARI